MNTEKNIKLVLLLSVYILQVWSLMIFFTFIDKIDCGLSPMAEISCISQPEQQT